MEKYTHQQAFDKAAVHLLTQHEKSMCNPKTYNGCAYRSEDGKKCAFGIFIPDSVYDIEMEGNSAGDIIDGYPEVKEQFVFGAGLFADRMQSIHDNFSVDNWKEELVEYAESHCLSTEVIDNL